jgi:hypothetical protein
MHMHAAAVAHTARITRLLIRKKKDERMIRKYDMTVAKKPASVGRRGRPKCVQRLTARFQPRSLLMVSAWSILAGVCMNRVGAREGVDI